MKQRLQKLLSARGVASRRKAEMLLLQQRVQVNGKTAALGDSADEMLDEILVDGRPLPPAATAVYIMLNKPRGYVTTVCDERGRPTVMELVADCGSRVYPIGRLDMDSEGLLLLTNDGALAQSVMHPAAQVDKTYDVWVSGFTPASLKLLQRPFLPDGTRLASPHVRLLRAQGAQAKLRITIHEGKNRQIRRMCLSSGLRVTRLRRIAEGGVALGDLPVGAWRHLTEAELTHLRAPNTDGNAALRR